MPVLNKVELDIYIYTGLSSAYSGNRKYQLSKTRISSQSNITFEIANLVRDYISHNFNNNYPSDTVWVRTEARLYDPDGTEFASGSPEVDTYIAKDGYGYFEDGINPQLSDDLLMTSNNIYLNEGDTGKLPIFAQGVGKVTIDSVDTQITDDGNTNQKIQYITIPTTASTIQVYDTDDTTLLRTVNVYHICEPKYTPFKVTFVNKYGAYQDLYFFKRTDESFNITDERYKRNIVDLDSLSYATYKGQSARYNVKANTSLKMNTGFILEDMNSTIEELFLSEDCWIRFENSTLPVIPSNKQIEFKTSLGEKLANYTVNFDFAFNKINDVR